MITGTLGLALYLWAIFGLTAAASVVLISLLQPLFLRQWARYSPSARRRLFGCLVVTPFFAGVLAMGITLFPSVSHSQGWSLDHCHYHGEDHGHLCWYHPASFQLLSGLGLGVLAQTLFVLYLLAQAMRTGWQHRQEAKTLMGFTASAERGFYRLDSDMPSAFTIGLLTPKRVISRALEDALTPHELNVVCHHESAHAQRRDPLQTWLFKLLTRVFPKNVRTRYNKAFVLAIEQDADTYVTRYIADRALIASTLIKVNRLSSHIITSPTALALCHFGTGTLEPRIRYLLANENGRAFPRGIILFSISAVMALGVFYADTLHHSIENFLSH